VIFQPSQVSARLVLVLPFVILIVTAFGLLAVSPTAWGAAGEFGYPDSLPVIGAVIFAAPAVVYGLLAVGTVWRRTSRTFRVAPRQMLLGLIPLAMAIGLLVAYAFLVGDPDSYRGQYNTVKMRWEPLFSQSAFLTATVLIAFAAPMGLFGTATWCLYCWGIEAEGLAAPEGPDPMGEIIRTGGARRTT
jgi:hypothetical protein